MFNKVKRAFALSVSHLVKQMAWSEERLDPNVDTVMQDDVILKTTILAGLSLCDFFQSRYSAHAQTVQLWPKVLRIT